MTLSVEEIAALPDPVQRNLWITQRYHELAVQLRDGGLADDATWCAFAVWASKTAGATIRGQELPSMVRDLLAADDSIHGALARFNHGLEGWLVKRLEHLDLLKAVSTVSSQVGASIAAGNVLVFSELAPLFTALVNGDAARLDAGLAALASQMPDASAVTAAFAAYRKAASSPEARPTLVLAGNILAVSHEQERLQSAIQSALDAAIHEVFSASIADDVLPHVPTAQARNVLAHLTDEVGQVLDRVWQTALTEMMLRLVTADETFDLHCNVPPLSDALFAPPLADISDSEAEGPYGKWDRTAGTGTPSGAHDWCVLGQRMNYIVTLFRSRQRHPGLFSPPFSDAQLAALADGRVPAGPL